MSNFLPGRYLSERDINFINSINDELLNDIIQTEISIFKLCPDATVINIYGESKPSGGKMYFPAVTVTALIDRAAISTEADDFGPTRRQNVVFKFMEKDLQQLNVFPTTGDLVFFNARYHEIDDIAQENFLGGQPSKSFDIIVNTHYTNLSQVDLVERQS